ncbi:MAG: hypothetical protein CMM01_21355, partial [Rhodopirellula sp.]|nr:hypothetical protein [Rhodopirellula sp.]
MWLVKLSKKKKSRRKNPIGREALRDVQERAVPRPSQYAVGKTPKKGKALNKRVELVEDKGDKLADASKRAARSSEAPRTKKRSNHLIPAGELVFNWKLVTSLIAVLTAAIIYALWPTLAWAEMAWRLEPDYSHGYLILPLACILLWIRRDSFPGLRERCEPAGLLLIALSIAMRVAGRLLYMDFLDGYSLIPLIAGLVWFLCGLPALKWSAPA